MSSPEPILAEPSSHARGVRRALPDLACEFALLFAGAGLACSPAPPPSVLLVTFDTVRYDRFGATGDPEAQTPVVDALAAEGLLFERAYASAPVTLPSHTTILTGLEPISHDVHNNGRFVLSDDVETLAEVLGRAGYATAAFVSALVLAPVHNLGQGFDVYSAPERRSKDPLDFSVPHRSGSEVTREALAWLAERGAEAPFFLWAHYYDPHLPRDVAPPFDAIPDPYRAEIAMADAELGKLLRGARERLFGRELLVVFTSDHGEGLGEHGEQTHALLAYDATLHVPLVLAGPGVPRGARSSAFARHVDVVPTVLGRAGLAPPAEARGRDLLAVWRESADRDDVLGWFQSRSAETDFGWAPIEGVRSARWKYTATPQPVELYDVLADPHELRNLAAAEPELSERMAARWAELRAAHERAGRAQRRGQFALDELEQLAALGYISAPAEFAPDAIPDPRRLAAAHGWVDAARSLAGAGRHDEAIATLEPLASVPAVRGLALRSLAAVYANAGRTDQAVAAYRSYIQITGSAEAWIGLARTLIDAGRLAEALDALEATEAPGVNAELLRARVLSRLGRREQAHAAIDAALRGRAHRSRRLHEHAILVLDAAPQPDGEQRLRALRAAAPQDSLLASRLGFQLACYGRPEQREEALSLLREAARRVPEDAEIQANLGWGAHALGLADEAVAALERAVELEGATPRMRMQLAFALRQVGEKQRALSLARSVLARQPGAPWAEEGRALVGELEADLASRRHTEPAS